MSLLRRGAVGLALTTSLTTALVAGLAPASHADTLEDTLVSHELQLGDVCREGTKTGKVGFALKRTGSGSGKEHSINGNTWANNTLVRVEPKTPILGLTLGTTSVTTPLDWTAYANNVSYPAGDVSVGVTVPKDAVLGAQAAAVIYTATGASAGDGSNSKDATVTVRWTVVDCAPKDTTAPKVTRALSPEVPSGTGDWYREDVTVDWSVTDAESAVSSTSGCRDETFTTDGTHTSSCSATSAGGTAGPVEATISIDRTPPEVKATMRGTIGDNGWYTGDVTVSWEYTDATSGIASHSPDCRGTTLTADTNGDTYTCTVFDGAGNKTEIVKVVKRDATEPAISSEVRGATGNGDWYVGDVTIDWTVTEATSGLDAASTNGCDDMVLTTDTNGTDYTCTATDKAGNSNSSTVPVKRDTAGPVLTYGLDGLKGAGSWYRGPVEVTWHADDEGGSGVAQGCTSETVSVDGVHLPECTAYDVAGNPTAGKALVQLDGTAPVITPEVDGTMKLQGSGWYTSDVDLMWTVTDPTSGVDSTVDCDKVTVVQDTSGTSFTCSATDVAGNADSQSVTIRRDTAAPSVSGVASGPSKGTEWFTGNATVTWTAEDATSGVEAACAATAITADGIHTPSCTVTDRAGHTATGTLGVKKDATAPVVTFTGGPAEGAPYYYGDPIPASTCSATDGDPATTSGVTEAGCSVSGGGTTVGGQTRTATAADRAGNVGTSTRTYNVVAWRLDGFYRPVVMDADVVNTVKAGSTVPLKFNVYKGSTPMTSGIDATFTALKVNCDSGDIEDVVEVLATGGTSLRYDAAGQQWVQNWATPGSAKGSCYRVTMTTADGSSIAADFMLK